MRTRWRSACLALLAMLVFAAACNSEEPTPNPAATTSTTTITVDIDPATAAVVTFGEDVPDGDRDRLIGWAAGVRGAAEAIRGLRFLDEPSIEFLSAEAYANRWQRRRDAELDPTELAVDTRFLQLLGLLAPGQSLRVLLTPAYETPPAAFYDGDRGSVVAAALTGAPSAAADRDVLAATVTGLTDQYHQHSARAAVLEADGMLDEADALRALATADAAYFALVYTQELAAGSRPETDVAVLGPNTPEAIVDVLAFPYSEGLVFVESLIAEGGIAALDAVYGNERLTTEQILHPDRYGVTDPILDVEQNPLALTGHRLHRTGSLGELGLRALLAEAQLPGVVRQSTDGWGGDRFATFTSGNDVAWVYLFRGDDAHHAREVAQAFIDLATDVMGLNEPLASGGGVEFVGMATEGLAEEEPRGPYVFVDRNGAGLVVVISSEVSAGRELAASVDTP